VSVGETLVRFDSHDHYQEVQPVPIGPAAYPTYAPGVEPGTQRNRSAKAKIFCFDLHFIPASPCSPHSSLCVCGIASPMRAEEWVGLRGAKRAAHSKAECPGAAQAAITSQAWPEV
jgi:hypothetical protein